MCCRLKFCSCDLVFWPDRAEFTPDWKENMKSSTISQMCYVTLKVIKKQLRTRVKLDGKISLSSIYSHPLLSLMSYKLYVLLQYQCLFLLLFCFVSFLRELLFPHLADCRNRSQQAFDFLRLGSGGKVKYSDMISISASKNKINQCSVYSRLM